MNSFEFQFATKMIFGKDKESCVGEEIKNFGGSRILLVYGGKSIKKSGLYDKVKESLEASGLWIKELAGAFQIQEYLW